MKFGSAIGVALLLTMLVAGTASAHDGAGGNWGHGTPSGPDTKSLVQLLEWLG